ncbi:NAD(P)-binding protein [Sulfurihydrogenibium sp.]|uniref:phytoene desaturase family protein n=1 Tax=Sulfurihydrogenibium sp. TaxID=2053621 RepID=UPI002631A61E|nr:NAD(P)-binding protein [Sulfurihydrogenibium sp.]
MFDYIIVGGGIGGVITYNILKKLGKNVLLIEKLNYLGGCAGTFEKDGMFYNVGASTLVGLDEGLPLDILLKILQLDKKNLPVIEIDPSIVVYVGDKVIYRYTDYEKAFEEINKNFYHSNNKELWEKIKKTSSKNWESIYKMLPFNPKNLKTLTKTALKNIPYLLSTFKENTFTAKDVITQYVKNPDKDYISFLNSQILMTTQCYWDEVNFSFASMGLTYPNLKNYYVVGGMSNFLENITKDKKDILRKTKVLSISKKKDVFTVKTNKGNFYTKKVILNRTIWDYCQLLDENLKNSYCEKNIKKYSKIWSSATLYFWIEDKENILNNHHYQVLHERNPYTDSYSFFVSVADQIDNRGGKKSITISTHCKIDFWENLTKDDYENKKERLKEFILNKLYKKVPAFGKLVKGDVMVGTPNTFKKYTERYRGSVGGIPLRREYTMLNYPVGITPIKNLYLVGDSVFPGQGYPGVCVGVFNLLLHVEEDFREVFYRHI